MSRLTQVRVDALLHNSEFLELEPAALPCIGLWGCVQLRGWGAHVRANGRLASCTDAHAVTLRTNRRTCKLSLLHVQQLTNLRVPKGQFGLSPHGKTFITDLASPVI